MNGREVTLGDHVKLITGYPFKSAEYQEEKDGFYRLLRGDNIGQGVLRWEGARFWPLSRAENYEAMRLIAGDVVLAMDRPWIGAGLKWAVVRQNDMPALLVQRVARLRGCDTLLQSYLPYVIASAAFTDHVQAITTGSNVPHISGRDIKAFRFSIPSVAEQRRIASILSAYDDLIEVNRRRVTILEEMARRLFEEWFVHLRFPGHEAVSMHDTPDGPLPEGWAMGLVSDLLTLHRGYDLATSDRSPGEVPIITGSGRNGTHDAYKIEAPGVVTGRSGTIGQVFLVHENFWPLNTALYVSSFTCVGPTFALFLLRQLDLRTRAGGAAVPTLNRNHVHLLPVLRPPLALMERYERLAAPALQQAWVLEQQSERLAAARGLLLPRLISGELSVADASIPDRLSEAAD